MLLEAIFVIGIVPVGVSTIKDLEYKNAAHHASVAYLTHTNMKQRSKNTIERLEDRYLSEDLRRVGVVLTWAVTVVGTKQISYAWSF